MGCVELGNLFSLNIVNGRFPKKQFSSALLFPIYGVKSKDPFSPWVLKDIVEFELVPKPAKRAHYSVGDNLPFSYHPESGYGVYLESPSLSHLPLRCICAARILDLPRGLNMFRVFDQQTFHDIAPGLRGRHS